MDVHIEISPEVLKRLSDDMSLRECQRRMANEGQKKFSIRMDGDESNLQFLFYEEKIVIRPDHNTLRIEESPTCSSQ